MAQIIFSHGDKGGVGKSMLSTLLVDHLTTTGYRVGIVEGDKSVPDLHPRYANQLPAAAINLNRHDAAEKAVIDFADAIEAMGNIDYVVVNTPASTGQTLDQIGEVLVAALAEYGHTVLVFYSIGSTRAALTSLKESTQGGLIDAAGGCVIAYHSHMGPRENHAYVRDGQAAQDGFPHIQINEIKPAELAQKVADDNIALADSVANLTVIERMLVDKKFRQPAHAELARALATVPNNEVVVDE